MNQDEELNLDQKIKLPPRDSKSDVDFIKTVQERALGFKSTRNVSTFHLQACAEDELVKKQFKEMRCEIPGVPRSTFLMVFSPDGTKVASTHGNHHIYVTDVRTGKHIKTLVGHPRTPWCIAFHPSSDQIIGSGCLGGQVRIWDLSGGSEVWTAESQTVIASIAFHPDDRMLVIASYNELFFWDWSKPVPFMHVATGSVKEKVRYVAFDKLGHKLITGITNGPQTRWERVRAPVPVPRPADRAASPYRRRITPRLIANMPTPNPPVQHSLSCTARNRATSTREPLSSVPERERRITTCYRDLVQQYEVLVHRYLQIYRPPVMIDQGTDPMEVEVTSNSSNAATNTQQPSTSSRGADSQQPSTSSSRADSPKPSTSGVQTLKKSSASLPAKNIRYKIKTESSPGFNSISFRCAKTRSTVGSTQTADEQRGTDSYINDIAASLSSSTPLNSDSASLFTNEPSTSDGRLNTDSDMEAHISKYYSSSSSDEDDDKVFLDNRVKESNGDKVQAKANEQQSEEVVVDELPQPQEIEPPDSAVYTYLNLARRGDSDTPPRERPNTNMARVTMTRRYVVPMISSSTSTTTNTASKSNNRRLFFPLRSSTSQTFNAPSSTEQKYKMRIKCSVGPTTTEGAANSAIDKSTSTHTPSTPNDNISDLIRNAELMLAKFRENLEQRGHLQGVDLPSTSRSIVSTQIKPKNRPSRGTNTNESEKSQGKANKANKNETTRKRLYYSSAKKVNKHHPILDSSDSSSSENDQKPKRSKFSSKKRDVSNEHTYAASVSKPNSNNDHCYAGNDNLDNAEHSYAGSSEPKPDNTMRIEIDVSPVAKESTSQTTSTGNQTIPITTEEVSAEFPAPINFNAELELLVTDLLTNDEPSASTPAVEENVTENNVNTNTNNNPDDLVCGSCGGALEERRRSDNSSNPVTCSHNNACTNTPTNTVPRGTAVSTDPPRRRFLSHRLSAFHPTRQINQSPRMYTVRSPNSLQPLIRSRLGNLNSTENPTRSPNFALDEVINYAERVNEEEHTRGYHPFDPPPELMSINPEHIGIGNMYSNIVQELESSLNDVRNIRANRRLGETSDMLSSFSERLESIMTQSNTILRNLSSSLDSLPVNETEPGNPDNVTRVVYRSMRSHGLIMHNTPDDPLYDLVHSPVDYRSRSVFANNNPVASDHTYPLNPDNPQSAANMSPLMLSLHLTVSHIQRQARLLRQQVESIERIDRAMLEVAQLQMMRQMFDELHRHFSSISENENPIGVSSVRQMMAGTSISDTSPYNSPRNENPLILPQPVPPQRAEPPTPSTSSTTQETQTHNSRSRARKTYPRCLFLMHRQFRRTTNAPTATRKCTARERLARKNLYRRYLPTRGPIRPSDVTAARRGYLNIVNPETLPSMTRRLEHFLMEHGRYIGRSIIPPTSGSNNRSDVGEHIMMLRLSNCRQRLNRLLGISDDRGHRNEFTSVTIDGSSRFGARQTLSSILDTLTRFMEVNSNSNITTVFRYHMWEVIELSLLLSEILLLQIVDSIPPPTGMNLDPERESLSTRIDQMCSRMLQSRISTQSLQLTRSLRLLRITVRHATQALGQTYTARRNAMLPINTDSERLDSRQGLLDDIHNCLRNIRRHRETATRLDEDTNPTGTEWYRTINDLISRYTNSPASESPSSSVLNNETGEETRPSVTVEDANSSDDNISGSTSTRESLLRPLYRTSNVNLLHNEESSPSGSRHQRLWNVPTVQVNDVPVSEPQHSPWHPRFVANRQRLSERLDELRTTGGLFRPRFLHPLYGGVYPFDGDLDDPHREQIYDNDIVATVTPNHRIQVWEFSQGTIPNISNALKNVVVPECKIHNDASVDYASDGSILVTLLPSGGYMNVTNRLGVYSLEWETLGQCLYVTSFEQNAVSVSLSPLNRHLVVGLASRRVPIMPSDRWTMARIFLLDDKEAPYGKLAPIRELEQNRDTSYMSVNCIRWLPSSGQGLVFATNTGHLRFLT